MLLQKKTQQTGSGDRFKTCVRSGDSFAGKGEWEKAINHYLEAISLNEKAKDVHEKLLKMYLNKGDKKGYTDALARFNAVKSGKPIPQDKLLLEPLQISAQECIKEEVLEEHSSLTQETSEELQNIQQSSPQIFLEEPPNGAYSNELLQKTTQEIVQEVLREPKEEESQELQQKLEKEEIEQRIELLQETTQEVVQEEVKETQMPQQKLEQDVQLNISPKNGLTHDNGVKDFSNPSDEASVLEEAIVREPDNMEVLERLNQLYTKGVKLSDSAVVAIYRKIYRMKI